MEPMKPSFARTFTVLATWVVASCDRAPDVSTTYVTSRNQLEKTLQDLCAVNSWTMFHPKIYDEGLATSMNVNSSGFCNLLSPNGGTTGLMPILFRGREIPGDLNIQICDLQIGPAFLEAPLPIDGLVSIIEHPQVRTALEALPAIDPAAAYSRHVEVDNVYVLVEQSAYFSSGDPYPAGRVPGGFFRVNGCERTAGKVTAEGIAFRVETSRSLDFSHRRIR